MLYIRGTPMWQLWLSRQLTIGTEQTSISISTFCNALTSKKAQNHEIGIYFSKPFIVAMCHVPRDHCLRKFLRNPSGSSQTSKVRSPSHFFRSPTGSNSPWSLWGLERLWKTGGQVNCGNLGEGSCGRFFMGH